MKEDLLGGYAKFLIKPEMQDHLQDLQIQSMPDLNEFVYEQVKVCMNLYLDSHIKTFLGIKTEEFKDYILDDPKLKSLLRKFRQKGDFKQFLISSKDI